MRRFSVGTLDCCDVTCVGIHCQPASRIISYLVSVEKYNLLHRSSKRARTCLHGINIPLTQNLLRDWSRDLQQSLSLPRFQWERSPPAWPLWQSHWTLGGHWYPQLQWGLPRSEVDLRQHHHLCWCQLSKGLKTSSPSLYRRNTAPHFPLRWTAASVLLPQSLKAENIQ